MKPKSFMGMGKDLYYWWIRKLKLECNKVIDIGASWPNSFYMQECDIPFEGRKDAYGNTFHEYKGDKFTEDDVLRIRGL